MLFKARKLALYIQAREKNKNDGYFVHDHGIEVTDLCKMLEQNSLAKDTSEARNIVKYAEKGGYLERDGERIDNLKRTDKGIELTNRFYFCFSILPGKFGFIYGLFSGAVIAYITLLLKA